MKVSDRSRAGFARLFGTPLPAGPSAVFALTALLGSTGNGAFAATAALFMTRAVGASTKEASIALTVAGATAIAANAAAGRYADRMPAVRAMVGLCALRALLYAVLSLERSFAVLLPTLCAALSLDLINQPVKQALMRQVLGAEERRQSFALQRSVINAAFALGAATAGLVVSLGSTTGLRAMILVNAGLFLPMLLLYARLGRVPRVGEPADAAGAAEAARPASHPSPWRDGRYLAFSTSNGMMTVSDAVIFFGLPLWIGSHTDAPIGVLSAVLVLNTAVTALTQARWARLVVGLRRGGRSIAAAGALLAAACFVFWSASHVGAAAACALLLAGGAAVSLAEALYTTAGWEVSVELAPEGHHAHYFSMTSGFGALSEMLGPVIIAALVLPAPDVGWGALAALFGFAGAAGWLVVEPRTAAEAVTA